VIEVSDFVSAYADVAKSGWAISTAELAEVIDGLARLSPPGDPRIGSLIMSQTTFDMLMASVEKRTVPSLPSASLKIVISSLVLDNRIVVCDEQGKVMTVWELAVPENPEGVAAPNDQT
jgi:hypothetical protein